MTELAIHYTSYRSNPITIDCRTNGKLRLYYDGKPLDRHGNAIVVELPPDGTSAVLELSFASGSLDASGDLSWTATSTGVLATSLGEPTSDFLDVSLTATQAGEVDTGKMYVKVKPHGGLPAGG